MNHLRNDTIHDPTDSLRWTWQQVRTPAARYSEALTHLQKGNFVAAFTVVNNIPVEHELRDAEVIERQRMLDLIAFVQQVGGSGRNMAQLTVPEVDALEMLVDGAHDRPAVWAQNLLCFAYERCAAPLTGGEPGPRAPQAAYDPEVEGSMNTLAVYPNPGNAWVAMDYAYGIVGEAWLTITDVTGRKVQQVRLSAERGQFIWDVRQARPGAYSVELTVDGNTLAVERLIIQP